MKGKIKQFLVEQSNWLRKQDQNSFDIKEWKSELYNWNGNKFENIFETNSYFKTFTDGFWSFTKLYYGSGFAISIDSIVMYDWERIEMEKVTNKNIRIILFEDISDVISNRKHFIILSKDSPIIIPKNELITSIEQDSWPKFRNEILYSDYFNNSLSIFGDFLKRIHLEYAFDNGNKIEFNKLIKFYKGSNYLLFTKWESIDLHQSGKHDYAIKKGTEALVNFIETFFDNDEENNFNIAPLYVQEFSELIELLLEWQTQKKDYLQIYKLKSKKLLFANKNNIEKLADDRDLAYGNLLDNFGELIYKNREIILISDSLPIVDSDSFITIKEDNTGQLQFHEQITDNGKFYYADQKISMMYYPLEMKSQILFKQKLKEAWDILCFLAPKKLTLESANEDILNVFKKDYSNDSSIDIINHSGKIATPISKIVDIGAGYHYKKETKSSNEILDEEGKEQASTKNFTRTAEFIITNLPTEPVGDFMFYQSQSELKDIVENRIKGLVRSDRLELKFKNNHEENKKVMRNIKNDLVKCHGINAKLKEKEDLININLEFKYNFENERKLLEESTKRLNKSKSISCLYDIKYFTIEEIKEELKDKLPIKPNDGQFVDIASELYKIHLSFRKWKDIEDKIVVYGESHGIENNEIYQKFNNYKKQSFRWPKERQYEYTYEQYLWNDGVIDENEENDLKRIAKELDLQKNEIVIIENRVKSMKLGLIKRFVLWLKMIFVKK